MHILHGIVLFSTDGHFIEVLANFHILREKKYVSVCVDVCVVRMCACECDFCIISVCVFWNKSKMDKFMFYFIYTIQFLSIMLYETARLKNYLNFKDKY